MADEPVAELVWPEVEISTNDDKVAAVAGVSYELAQLQGLDCTMSFMLVHRVILRMQLTPTTHATTSALMPSEHGMETV